MTLASALRSRTRKAAALSEERRNARVSITEAEAAIQEMHVEEMVQENWVNVNTTIDENTLLAMALSASLATNASQELPAQDTVVNTMPPPTTEDGNSPKARNCLDTIANRKTKKVTVLGHKRTTGKKVTAEDRRATRRCYEVCRQEKDAVKLISTADPFARTANYLGMSVNTVKNIILVDDDNYTDERGQGARLAYTEHSM
ncbi:hypothetical protein BGZ83_001083 [Gryganskiella cystojenkinii]|nr:hypothetical protein BGZ83_001083 [Gryganskiella cystojenkinii]